MNTPVTAKLHIMKHALLSSVAIVTLALAGCAVGPNYKRPTTETPAHYKADQAAAQDRAVANSRRAAELASERYRAGIVSYLEVVDAIAWRFSPNASARNLPGSNSSHRFISSRPLAAAG